MKKMITKKLIALLGVVLLFASTSLKAQFDATLSKKESCDYLMKQSSCIFEGKIIPSSKKLFTTNDGATYSSVLVEIEKIIKGDIQKGTIEIIKFQYRTDKDGNRQSFESSDIYEPEIPTELSLFFCADDKKVPNTSGVIKKNNIPVKIVEVVPASNNVIPKQDPRSALKDFTTINELYNYLSANYSITIDKSMLEKKSPINTTIDKKVTSELNAEQLRKLKEAILVKARLVKANKTSSTGCVDVIISEYLCGQGNNKSIELYNTSSTTISLANYSILIYHGSSYTPTTIALTGTISAHSTYVVSKPNASATILVKTNQTSNNLNFNGDEIIVLSKATVDIDKIGVIGTAIGSGGWTLTPTGSTKNTDLRRKYSIAQGDTNWINCKTEWDVFSNDSTSNIGTHSNSCSSPPSIDPLTLTITNVTLLGDSLHFDVSVSSNPTQYLDQCQMYIQYSHAAFGDNVISSGNATITMYNTFPSSNYFFAYFDIAPPDTMYIGMSTHTSGTINRTQVNGTPKPMVHVALKIKNCGQSPNIAFQNPPSDYSTAYFTTSPNTNDTTVIPSQYDTTYYTGSYNTPLHCMEITDFTSPIDAGIGNILTITGTGFGSTRGNGQVKFKNADNGGATYVSMLNNIDYVVGSWTDTQIQIRLPNFVSGATGRIIGGGNFIVTNNAGQSDTSIINSSFQPFYVCYNLRQVWATDSSKKIEVDLRNDNHLGGYTIRFNPTDFPVGSARRNIFQRAMRDWTCLTGVNWIVGADTTIVFNSTVADNINYMSFTTDSLTPSITASTYAKNATCSSYGAVLTEADILFNGNKTFLYDTTLTQDIPSGQIDYYGVCLHELGHFIGLQHSTDPTNLMYYSGLTGYIAMANRKSLVIGSCPVEGGTYSVGQSSSNATTCSGLTTMIPENSSSCTSGIEQYHVGDIHLYPNPTAASITIQGTSSLGTITVYNTLGQLITQQTTKENNAEIDLSQQAAGFYLVKIQNQYIKIIKE